MARCRVDPTIKRVTIEHFDFPLGCYPVEDVKPLEGFTLHFEPADGGESARDDDRPGEGGRADAEGPGGLNEGEEFPDRSDPADVFGGESGDDALPMFDAGEPEAEADDDAGEPPERGRGGRAGTPRPPKAGPPGRDQESDRAESDAGGADGADEPTEPDETDEPEPRVPRESGTRDQPRPDFGSAESMREDQDSGEWEEWPDRYVWDVLIRASRVDALLRALYSLLPGRVFPILDVLGNDAYREIDPYVSYEPVGMERFLDAARRFRGYLMEDGFVGFGVMSEEPFLYIFVDEHKVVTVRAESALKERVDAIMAAFDLKQVESLTGADSAVHEHRGVLDAPPDRPDLLTAEEIVEELRDVWGLELNVDPHRNLDDQGRELGITGWRCVVRLLGPDGTVRYLEVCLTASSLMEAHDLAVIAAEQAHSEEEEDESSQPSDRAPSTLPGKSPSVQGPGSKGSGAAGGAGGTASPTKGLPSERPDPSAGKRGGPRPCGKDRGEPPTNDPDDAATQFDVVVTDRLSPRQLEDFARELGHKGSKPTRKACRVWVARWVD